MEEDIRRHQVVGRFLEAIITGPEEGLERFRSLYTPSATLDAVVPGWRWQCQGPEAIAAEYEKWFNYPAVVGEVRRHGFSGGEVLEYTIDWDERGVAHRGRHVHVLTVEPSRLISEDHVWCGGRWDAALVAAMSAVGQ